MGEWMALLRWGSKLMDWVSKLMGVVVVVVVVVVVAAVVVLVASDGVVGLGLVMFYQIMVVQVARVGLLLHLPFFKRGNQL